jgi:Sec-independent protein secretion pathway component TatC
MSANKDYVDPQRMKKNWRFVIICIVVIGAVLYWWLHG